MRRLLTAAFSLVVIPSALVALPVVSTPAAAPHPVAPSTVHVSVALPAGLTTAAAAGVNSLNSALRALTPAAGGAIAPSPPQDTANFRAAGLSWLHDSKITSLKALVRVRNNGQWGPWQEIENTDIGADNGRDVGLSPVRDGTDPLWVDHANGVQVQLESVTGGLPRDLRLDLVDPGTSAADSAPSGSSPLSSAAVARADTTQPAIFTRADWGADESLRLNACPNGPGSAGAIKVAFVHHTVTGNSYNPGDVPAIIRSIYAFHVQSEGWCDVGYNFLVDKFGRIWEGRYGGIDQAPLGAHTGGFNTNSFGVSMIGEFSSLTPPVAMTDAITRLVAWKFSMAYLNPLGHESLTAASFSQNRFSAGTIVSFNTISGHRDADQTACPGNAGYAVLPFVRNAVMATMVAGLADPATAVTPRTISANGSVRVTSGMLQAGSWQLSVQDPSGTQVRTLAGSGTSIDTTWNMTSDDGQPVAPGSYTLTLTSNQAGASARPWTRTVQVGGSFGSLDGVAAPGVGTVVVQGWALHGIDDQPATVRLTVSAAPADTVTATASRPDVAARYPGYSAAHGFVDTLSTSPGFHTICAYAVNDTGGADTYLGCRGVTVPGVAAVLVGPAANPVGFLDVVQGGPTAVHVAGWTIDPETTNPISVAVYVDTTFMGFITANTSRPDVGAVHPGYGAAHGFDRILGGVVPGNHRVCVYAMNIGNGTTNPTLGCATVRVPTGNPIGHLDTVSPTPGGIVTWGWALDPDTAAPIPVHVYVDGRLAAVLAANQPRADVARALPVYGYLHGYAAAITMAGGHHVVCEYALNVGPGSANTALGCRSVSVLAGNPIGRLDAVVPVPGGVILWGWSIDPDTRTADSVAISVDGREATRLTANLARPDVQGVYPAYGVAHGFATFLAVSGGAHTVCANGINVAAGSANPQLGCHAVSVLAGNPIGRLEFAGAAGGTLSLWGWAIDPDVTTPVAVHVYVDGHLATILAANANRPDVAKLYPSYGAAHGYQVQLPVAAGTHSVCTYAINVAAGSTNSQLGCRSVKG